MAKRKTAGKPSSSSKRKPTRRSAAPSKSKADSDKEQYQKQKQRTAKRGAEQSHAGRDIGTIPARKDPKRRRRCRKNFRAFCEAYFPGLIYYNWSPAHLRVIKRIETAVLKGGLFAVAMPRSSGKTTLTVVACLWALLMGHRRFVMLIAANLDSAMDLLESIKTLLETNQGLLEDFPEVCVPVRELNGVAQKANAQHYKGVRTRMDWSKKQMILPTIKGSASSGSLIRVKGITGHIRGQQHAVAGDEDTDNEIIRPDFVILDDPQSDEDARSPDEVKKRIKVLNKAILNLGGPGKRISGVCPCTVIEPDDMADQLLDPKKSPKWKSERTKMMLSMPTNLELWEEYKEVLLPCIAHDDMSKANDFYRKHRKQLEKGAEHYWPDRVDEGFVSAIQSAMNWWLTDPEGFSAEAQNDPKGEIDPDADLLTFDEIREKMHTQKRDVIPMDADLVVAHVDVQGDLLYYCVIAFNRSNFTGYILRYGSLPEQSTRNFTLARALNRLSTKYVDRSGKSYSEEARIRAGLFDLCDELLAMQFQREDDLKFSIAKLAVDTSYQTELIKKFVREYDNEKVIAAFGRTHPLTGKSKGSDKSGPGWRARTDTKEKIRYITFHTDVWKSHTHARFSTPRGVAGSLSLHAETESFRHDTFARHMRAENRRTITVRQEDRDIEVHKWEEKPNKPDNHWFDNVVGCHVIASHEGTVLFKSHDDSRFKRKQIVLSELQGTAI